jgi:hypothetical protein
VTVPAFDVSPMIAAIRTAIVGAGLPFGDANRPNFDATNRRPYVVGWFDGGQVIDRTMRYRDGMVLGCVFHTYGYAPDSVRGARRALIDALLSLHGTTAGGWVASVPVPQSPIPMDRDSAVSPPLYWQTDEVSIRLAPA